MKTETFHLEIITPCFCGGAEPEKHAEIRAPSIRGQLRWWFRTLGGFISLAPMPVREQETMIFGSTSGGQGQAGKLVVRVSAVKGYQTRSTAAKNAEAMNARVGTDCGYLLFPLRTQSKSGFDGGALPQFDMQVQWRGNHSLWNDLTALVAVFGNLGSLGFRGRRAMGALAIGKPSPMSLPDAFSRFSSPHLIQLKQLQANSAGDAMSTLGAWLKSCRAHGRSGQNNQEMSSPYFRYAKNDHDIGYNTPDSRGKSAFRPALGLPIIQRTRDGTNNWEWDWDVRRRKALGRFASPVILRPHRDAQGKWHALVIFVDAHKWPAGKQVYLNGEARDVSDQLYNAMKNDQRLQPFP